MKISTDSSPTTYIRSDGASAIFPRDEHPDTRSNAEFLKALEKKKALQRRIWYPITKQKEQTAYKIRIRCLTNGKEYNSISEAAKDLKIDDTNIGRHLKGHVNYSHISGFKFEFI